MNDDITGPLSDGTARAHWLRTVIKTKQITDSIRVLLMTFALHMDASGRVSVPRVDLAELLGRDPRKVGEKVKTALESGFLVQIVRGQKHRTAVYVAAFNGQPLSMPPGGPAENFPLRMPPGGPAEDSQVADFYDPEQDSQGPRNRHPEPQEADLRMSPGGPAEDSQVAPRGAPHMYRGSEVSEEADLSDGSLFGVEDAASRRASEEPKKPAKSRRKPETPVPADFAVTPEMRAWADEKGYTVDLDRQTFRFINHAIEKERLCRDWLAAWRNWVDKAQEIQDRDSNVRQLRPTGTHGGSGPMATGGPYSEEDVWK
ncbi:hypothetical protein HS041_12130 [Planomonospora sp. ID67723]|uniref:hypothetical protein n=1 Tax=Planomonospora sp. ID67723 TaxID=2738134 RepID=UPI0018C436E8|nr:hypothetical protein [Planomonospora sp. ID67723]MBG0828516.1 hypothetical protein [Planomonospora sp. ID67723]